MDRILAQQLGLLQFLQAWDPMDFSDKYNTFLPPALESEFQQSPMAKDVRDYDSRGAWLELKRGTMKKDQRGHLGDKYKKPNHPTFSDQSIYHGKDGYWGGSWTKDNNGRDVFLPGITNMFSQSALRDYFDRNEQGVGLYDARGGAL